MSDPLESGPYFLFSVSFAGGPDVPPVSRPLGPGQNPFDVVVLPLGSRPPVWIVQRISEREYSLSVDGLNARIIDDSLVVSPLRLPPFEWGILRGAPSPPPIGRDNFGILVLGAQPQQSWTIPSTAGDQAVEVRVKIGGVASSIHIVRAYED